METTNSGYKSVDTANPEIKRAIDLVTSQNASLLERDILYLTGIPKHQNEKHYNYLKRAVQERFNRYEETIKRLRHGD